jgi:hypothetical protein
MFKVDTRFIGEGLWSRGALPATFQAAWGQAKANQQSRFADEVRITSAPTQVRAINLRV